MFLLILIFFSYAFSSEQIDFSKNFNRNNRFYYMFSLGAEDEKKFRSKHYALYSSELYSFSEFLKNPESIIKKFNFSKNGIFLNSKNKLNDDEVKSILSKNASMHFSSFEKLLAQENFYSYLYYYFSLRDKKEDFINKERLEIWSSFFDNGKEADLLNKFFVSKLWRNLYLRKKMPRLFLHKNYLNVEGNCNGLALYCFFHCLFYEKSFKANHIITLGAIEENGAVGRVGASYNKITYWLIYLLGKMKKGTLSQQGDVLFLISKKYPQRIFESIFEFFQKKFQVIIPRFYISHVKDLEQDTFFEKKEISPLLSNTIEESGKGFYADEFSFSSDSLLSNLESVNLSFLDIYKFYAKLIKDEQPSWFSFFRLTKSEIEREIFSLAESVCCTSSLSLPEKKEVFKIFTKEEITNVCSWYKDGGFCKRLLYGDK